MNAIPQLIKRIVALTPKGDVSQFSFVLLEQSQVEKCFGLPYREEKNILGVDEAVMFLFDCDIHLWQLVTYEVRYRQGGGYIWNITLKR